MQKCINKIENYNVFFRFKVRKRKCFQLKDKLVHFAKISIVCLKKRECGWRSRRNLLCHKNAVIQCERQRHNQFGDSILLDDDRRIGCWKKLYSNIQPPLSPPLPPSSSPVHPQAFLLRLIAFLNRWVRLCDTTQHTTYFYYQHLPMVEW